MIFCGGTNCAIQSHNICSNMFDVTDWRTFSQRGGTNQGNHLLLCLAQTKTEANIISMETTDTDSNHFWGRNRIHITELCIKNWKNNIPAKLQVKRLKSENF